MKISAVMAQGPPSATADAFLDAAEQLLVEVGHARITTRRLAVVAGTDQGLVHYFFGSLDELFVRVLERCTERLIARQRALYAGDGPFLEKWRAAWRYQDDDLDAGYSKVWMELQAASWSDEGLRHRVARVNREWRAVLREAFERAAAEYGVGEDELPVEALVALTMILSQGYALERLERIDDGHEALLAWLERRLEGLEERRMIR